MLLQVLVWGACTDHALLLLLLPMQQLLLLLLLQGLVHRPA